MAKISNGFSLIELLMALTITLGIGTIMFQLFQQNERIFRDQNLVIEMQQTARVAASQIADEIRTAGQGVPIHASTFDTAIAEGMAVILAASTGNRIDFRAGLSNLETNVTTPAPLDFTLGVARAVTVGQGSLFSTALGTTNPSGKFVYLLGPGDGSSWAWVWAELTQINANTLTLIPREAGDAGRSEDVIRFTGAPTLTLEEAVSFTLSANTVRRATASNMINQISPSWSAANEIGRNITSLTFTYFDKNNNPVIPASLAARISIARIDISIIATTSSSLSNGKRPTYALAMRTIPRNARLR